MYKILSIYIQPPSNVRANLLRLTKALAQKYGVYGQMREFKGPHITIFSLKVDERDFDETIGNIRALCGELRPFAVTVDGWGYFLKPDTAIYLKVVKTREMKASYKALDTRFKGYKIGYPRFNPHISIMHNKARPEEDARRIRAAIRELKGLRFRKRFTVSQLKVSAYTKGIKGHKFIGASVKTVKLKS